MKQLFFSFVACMTTLTLQAQSLKDFPLCQQTTEYTCGPVSALMVLEYVGLNDETETSLAQKMRTHTDSSSPGSMPGTAHILYDYGTDIEKMHRYFETRRDIEILASSFMSEFHGEVLTDTLHVGIQAVGNHRPHFANYEEAEHFFSTQLSNGFPVVVCWASWGGHWTVLIGIDNGGTPDYIEDDILIMADPYDTFDRKADGLTEVPFVQFFHSWFCVMSPKPWQLQPFIVVTRKKTI